jgi:hypothetical protein
MAGTSISNFTDFVKFTGPAYFTSAEKFLNEAIKQTYSMPRFLKGRGLDKVIQGGSSIKDDVMFDEARTFQNYKPNAEFTWTQPQVATEQEINWRFSIDHMSWTDHEITLNMNSGFTRGYANVQYKKLRKKIEQRCWTSIINGFEEKLWADAGSSTIYAEMEGDNGSEQYSIPSYITEDTTNYHASGWTNIMGIDPANESKWRNQVETYDYDDPEDSDFGGNGLIDAFDDMLTKIQFIPPDFHKEHFESSDFSTFRQFIACSRGGLNLYKKIIRSMNDTLVRKQDASYNRPQFDGVDLVYVAQLDSASIFWNPAAGGSAATEANGTPDGYRYYWINGNYMTPVFHSERYFYKKDPFFLEKQPYTWVCPIDVWWNLFCHSRQRQGIVAPA